MEQIVIVILALLIGFGAHYFHKKSNETGPETTIEKVADEVEDIAELVLKENNVDFKFEKDNNTAELTDQK